MGAAEQSAPPRAIGRYEVIAEIAQGGMGVVYLARHAGEGGFQRLFAIKLMHVHLAEDRVFVDMLRDEARIAARIHHPNVVPILDLGADGGRYFVVMEYVDGCSLAALLARNKPARPPELVAAILIDALDGLDAAHSLVDENGQALNLVHRDMSPQNVLIGTDGMGRITDFGIAKAETRITSTRPGMRKGKISYMAPEQIKEDGDNVDRRADVFAAGAVLWGALTAQPLFRGQSDAATLHNILNKPIVPPSAVGLRPPVAFDAVCLKALERDPNKRFASAAEMADALREAASKIGLRATRAQVAQWVSSSFSSELEARRAAIREAMRRSRPPSPDESLPALPPLAGPPSLGSISSQSGSMPALSSTPPPSLTAVASTHSVHPGSEEPTRTDFRPRRAVLYAGGGAALLLLLLTIWIASRPSDEPPPSSAGAPSAAPPPRAAVVPPPAPEPTAEPPPVPSATVEKERPKTWRDVPQRPRAPASRPEPKPEPTAATKPEPKPAPAPAPAPTAKPTSTSTGVKIEKNPYLRQE